LEHLSADFWTSRYTSGTIGWDLGQVSPPIKAYIDQLNNKDLRILIPGCGNGYEAEYLWNEGFKNVHVVDLAMPPLKNLKERCSSIPEENLYQGDFFQHEGVYDLIIEQTMFCAIHPDLRQAYADQVYKLLDTGGKLVGVMFGRDFDGGPPYGGNEAEYRTYFSKFDNVEMEECHNSIEPRHGSELFVKISK